MLSSTLYDGLQILVAQGQDVVINSEVLIRIVNKIDSDFIYLQICNLLKILLIILTKSPQLQ